MYRNLLMGGARVSASSSSSSSSNQAPTQLVSFSRSSSSSSVPCSIVKLEPIVKLEREDYMESKKIRSHDEVGAPIAASSSADILPPTDLDVFDCVDMMDNYGCMDTLQMDDIWDPYTIYNFESPNGDCQQDIQLQSQQNKTDAEMLVEGKGEGDKPAEDLAVVFFEWLKSNRDCISAEDLRSIKLKKSTIEAAAKRLGGGQQGMKQLLKLVLQWIQNHHLQKKRLREETPNLNSPYQSQNPNPNLDPQFATSAQWNISQSQLAFPVVFPVDPVLNGHTLPSSEYQDILDSTETSTQSHVPVMAANFNNSFQDTNIPPPFISCGENENLIQNCDSRLVRTGSSASKEARKNRMARHRRLLSHHRSQNHQNGK